MWGNFNHAMIISIILFVILRIIIGKKRQYMNKKREVLVFIFFVYFLVVLFLTVFKSGGIYFVNQFESYRYNEEGIFGIINAIPFKETINTLMNENVPIMNPIRNIVGNILVFMPLGFIIPILFKKYDNLFNILKLGFVCSFMIEFTQLFVGDSICDIDDIIFNTTGAILGYLVFKMFIIIVNKLLKVEKLSDDMDDEKTSKLNIHSIINEIREVEEGSLFVKSIKVIVMIGVVCIGMYIGTFYNESISVSASNEEIINKLHHNGIEKIKLHKDIENKKFIVINENLYEENNDDYYEIVTLENMYDRYIITETNSFELVKDNSYMASIVYDNGLNMYGMSDMKNIIVIGKNKDASKIVINVGDYEYEEKINKNSDFLVLLPNFIKMDDEKSYSLYEGKDDYISIQFYDENNKEINYEKNLI